MPCSLASGRRNGAGKREGVTRKIKPGHASKLSSLVTVAAATASAAATPAPATTAATITAAATTAAAAAAAEAAATTAAAAGSPLLARTRDIHR